MNQRDLDRKESQDAPSSPARDTDESPGTDFDMSYGSGQDAKCRECNATVPGNSKFCPGCGARMLITCFACAATSSAGARFCGDCGADLVNGLETQVTLFEEKLTEARQQLEEANCQKVFELLSPIASAKNPILARYSGEANELISRAIAVKAEEEKESELLHESAQASCKRLQYHEALQQLEQIKPPFRTESILVTLDEVSTITREMDQLSEQLTDRTVRRHSPEWLANVERLLELQPNHVIALPCAEKFREYAHRQAQKSLGQDQLDQATEILSQVPDVVATKETTDLLHRAKESSSLRWDLFRTPTIDRTLVDVARRLQEMDPENTKFVELHDRLKRIAAKQPEDSALPPARWANPPTETPLGCLVDWITGFGETPIAETVDRTFIDRFPGSFFTAFGLALQGLGKATIDINFMKGRKSLGLGLRSIRSAWGLDISSGGLKAIRLDFRKKDQSITIGACELIEHRKPLSQANGSPEEKQLIVETLEVFRDRGHKRLENVCVSLPEVHSISRHVKTPPSDTKKLAEVMEYESKIQFAELPGDMQWGYHALEAPDETSPHRERQVLLVAVRDLKYSLSLEALQASKINVDQVQVDWLGLANGLIHLGHLASPEELSHSAKTVAVLDIGSEASSLLIQGPGMLDLRPVRTGGHMYTRALAHEFQLPLADAEQLKRDPTSLELLSRFQETLQPIMDDMIRDLNSGLDTATRDNRSPDVTRILAVGGGMHLHGLWRYLLYGR